jgi:hypothetical protein
MTFGEMKDVSLKRTLGGIGGTIVVGVLAACTPNEGRFVIKNNAAEPIVRASVLICGQTEHFEQIDVRQMKTGTYHVTTDSHYDVKVEFRSGRILERKLGYVTNGLNFDDELTVSDADIEITSKNKH